MATRSFISIKHSDDTFSGVYCHWDGYPEFTGKVLKEDYQDRKKVIELIDGGSMSSIKTRNTWTSGPTLRDEKGEYIVDDQGMIMSENDRDPQPLYHSERGDSDVDPKHFNSEKEMFDYANGSGCEYLYTYEDLGEDQPKWSFCKIDW
jgi:hypothetical protein